MKWPNVEFRWAYFVNHCHKQIQMISVISIMGTTEESAVDPLDEILSIREKLSKEVSLSFYLILF